MPPMEKCTPNAIGTVDAIDKAVPSGYSLPNDRSLGLWPGSFRNPPPRRTSAPTGRLFFMSRLFFRPTPRPAPRVRPSASVATVAVIAACVGIGFFFGRAPSDAGMERRFATHRVELERLRDMILAEPVVNSVGVDNVGDYWFFDGRWVAAGNRFATFDRREMLEATGLSEERHRAYLSALSAARAYRVLRKPTAGTGRWGRVVLFPPAKGEVSRRAPTFVFSERPPEPLLSLEKAQRSHGTAYARLADGWYAEFSHR